MDALREARGWSQSELARALGVWPSALTEQRKHSRRPSARVRAAIVAEEKKLTEESAGPGGRDALFVAIMEELESIRTLLVAMGDVLRAILRAVGVTS